MRNQVSDMKTLRECADIALKHRGPRSKQISVPVPPEPISILPSHEPRVSVEYPTVTFDVEWIKFKGVDCKAIYYHGLLMGVTPERW